jgi:chemotaxis protein methyltransferase CheR
MSRRETEYAQLRQLVTTQPAQEAGSRADSLFETRISSISRLALAANLEGLVTILRESQPEHLQRAILEAKAINETSFFRDAQPFATLLTHVFPRLIKKRAAERRLRIWCAACSTGQEAYSLALLLVESFPGVAQWDLQILGTDCSPRAITYAKRAVYRRAEVDQGLPANLLQRYFTPQGESFELVPDIRRLCEFRVATLGEPLPELPVFDLILLRNVLLYLPHAERNHVFETMHRQLWQRGFLMLGSAEQAEDFTPLFKPEEGLDSHFYKPQPAP